MVSARDLGGERRRRRLTELPRWSDWQGRGEEGGLGSEKGGKGSRRGGVGRAGGGGGKRDEGKVGPSTGESGGVSVGHTVMVGCAWFCSCLLVIATLLLLLWKEHTCCINLTACSG